MKWLSAALAARPLSSDARRIEGVSMRALIRLFGTSAALLVIVP